MMKKKEIDKLVKEGQNCALDAIMERLNKDMVAHYEAALRHSMDGKYAEAIAELRQNFTILDEYQDCLRRKSGTPLKERFNNAQDLSTTKKLWKAYEEKWLYQRKAEEKQIEISMILKEKC